MNLFLALLWLVAALLLFLWPWFIPRFQPPTILGTGLSLGWGALFLCLFNLVRWGSLRAAQRKSQALQQQTRRRWEEKQRAQPRQAPDPTFDFSEGPPPRQPEPPEAV